MPARALAKNARAEENRTSTFTCYKDVDGPLPLLLLSISHDHAYISRRKT